MARKKKPQTDELQELDAAYWNLVGGRAVPRGKRSSTLLITILSILLAGIIGTGAWLLLSDNWLTMKDVTVAGISMNGMTKKEAKAALSQLAAEKYASESMTVTVLDTTVEIPAQDAAIEIDVNTAINQAYQCTGTFDLSPYITLNSSAVDAIVASLTAQYNTNLQPTTEYLEGGANGPTQTLVLKLGSPELGLDGSALRAAILAGYSTGTFAVTGECTVIPPEMPTAQELYEKYLTVPVDAVMDKKTFVITPETYGYSVDTQQAAQLLANAEYGDTLRIPFFEIPPETTSKDLLATLYQDILGECSTPYSGSDTNNRNTNLGLACEKINGTILLPGETFSFNKTLGERTAANGWKPAASYAANGLTVDTYGGGICQGSTTLYNCVLQADFKIVECYPHGYISSYVEPGLDASVNWGTADFRFTNTSNWPIKIEAYRKNGKMTMRIYGTDEKDYYVKMTYKVVSSRAYETVYQEVDPANNPKGYKDGQELVSPYTGYRVITYKNRYSKKTNALIETKQERDFTYSHRDRVLVKFVTKQTEENTKPTS